MNPFVEIPLKRSPECSFDALLYSYIEQVIQEDPGNYESEIQAFQKCHVDARNVERVGANIEKNTIGRDLLCKYYGQIEYLVFRFPIDENGIKCLFEWHDAFSGLKVSQYSIAFEKANILFNSGAIASSIAASAKKCDSNDLKIAYNYFQLSAGYFKFIKDNFLHPPSVDLSRESIAVLIELMLGQAQESFIEKVILEGKKGLLVSKLAAHLSAGYATIVEGMAVASLKGQFPPVWNHLFKLKCKYFSALAFYHKSLHCEAQNEYGSIITYLTASNNAILEALKTNGTFSSNFDQLFNLSQTLGSPLFSSSASSPPITSPSASITGEDIKQFESICRSLSATVTEALKIALKDNDLLYHASVPAIETLPPLEKFNAAKPLMLHEILPNRSMDVKDIIGKDIFAKFVPQDITVKSSCYDNKKDSLIRHIKEIISSSEDEIESKLKSVELRETIRMLQNGLNSRVSQESLLFPEELMNSIGTIGTNENSQNSISAGILAATEKNTALKNVLRDIGIQFDQEQHECETLRMKYRQSWSQKPSLVYSKQYLDEKNRIENCLQTHTRNSQQLSVRVSNLSKMLDLFCQPRNSIMATFSGLAQPKSVRSPSLLDDSIADKEDVVVSDKTFLLEMEAGLEKLSILGSEKKRMADQLIQKLKMDDISNALLLGKGREEEIIATELEKFQPLLKEIESKVENQANHLEELLKSFATFSYQSQTLKEQKLKSSRISDTISEWTRNVSLYYELDQDVKASAKALAEYELQTNDLHTNALQFINQRAAERNALMNSIESEKAENDKQGLLSHINRMNLSQTASFVPAAQSIPLTMNSKSNNLAHITFHDPLSLQSSQFSAGPPSTFPSSLPPPITLPSGLQNKYQPGSSQPNQSTQSGYNQPNQSTQPGYYQQPPQPGYNQPNQSTQHGYYQPQPTTQSGYNQPNQSTQPGYYQPQTTQSGYNQPNQFTQHGYYHPQPTTQPGFNQPQHITQPGYNQPNQSTQPGYYQQPPQPGYYQPNQSTQPGYYQPQTTQSGYNQTGSSQPSRNNLLD